MRDRCDSERILFRTKKTLRFYFLFVILNKRVRVMLAMLHLVIEMEGEMMNGIYKWAVFC